MSTSVHADAPPAVVTDPEGLQYATGKQLGKGGFAICHTGELLGHRHLASNTVALKIVKSRMEPPKLAQKFVTELQIHSKLAHPNIVEFFRAFSFEASTYVVLELCENGSLADAIKKRKYFTMPEIRRFMIQTCGAIKYLHQRNIVHRDLKTGNLFLDKDMNIKVGDFGLAALLVSQSDFGAIRRTTMCGTPNYLAPEVLEKTGRGHDEKVDLWAIGIMMYTLAVGKAPFHAAKREDIYRKLKAREYSWPDLAKFPNEITDDLRDVVATLLVPEDDRPTPDEIVSHPFFKLGHIPLELDSACTSRVPRWNKIRPPTASTIRRGYTQEWAALCKASAVGEYEPGKTYGALGSRRNKTVARDCQKEIESGKQPSIPFSKDTVYLPFPARTQWPFQATAGLSEITEEKESSSEGQALVETTGNDRAAARPPRTFRAEVMPISKENAEPLRETEAARRTLDRQPTKMRSVRKISNPDRVTAASAAPAQLRIPKHTRTIQRTRSTRDNVKEKEEPIIEVREVRPTTKSETPEPSAAIQPAASSRNPSVQAVGPGLPSSDPTAVLARLSSFRDNVARALQRKPSRSSPENPPQLPFVSRWVDYSRKHGVGYVLEDGTIGCLMAATSLHPVTVAVSKDGYEHLKRLARNPDYMERIPIEYYANATDREGLSRVEVTNKERRDIIQTIWVKFGKYMCQQLGIEGRPRRREAAPTNFVKFYQRLGNVGSWCFADGSFQFNFPDHTKLVFSADAGYCNFTCLSVEATEYLCQTGSVPFKYIKDREILHGSLQRLLYGSAEKADTYKGITEANSMRTKLEFIISVVDGWIEGGGLGCLARPQEYAWTGPQLEDNKKQDWVTVGRQGGDVL